MIKINNPAVSPCLGDFHQHGAEAPWLKITEVIFMAKKETVCYVCAGSCHGVASEEQWKAGAKTCAAADCELHGKPLKRKVMKK